MKHKHVWQFVEKTSVWHCGPKYYTTDYEFVCECGEVKNVETNKHG